MTDNRTKLFVVASTGTHVALDITAFNDAQLSYKAMGIHAYIRTRQAGELLAMPDLITGSCDGEFAVRSGVKELLDKNYLHLIRLRDEQGRIGSTVYVSTPVPMNVEASALQALVTGGQAALPYGGFPHMGNHAQGGLAGDSMGQGTPSGYPPYTKYYLLHNPDGLYKNNTLPPAGGRYEEEALKLFTAWNQLEGLPTHKRGEQFKTYRQAIKHLSKALRNHSAMVIRQAMEDYSWLVQQPYTVLRSKQAPMVVGLNEFFKFSHYSDKLRSKSTHPLCGIESWFMEAKKGRPYLEGAYTQLKKDPNPKITAALTEAVLNSAAFGVRTQGDLKPVDKNTLIKASTELVAFMDAHQDRLPKRSTVSTCINRLLMYLVDGGSRQLHLGYLVSDITWREFSTYMVEQGVMESPAQREPLRRQHGTGTAAH